MSRPSHLPPRCPLQNKCLRTRSLDPSDLFSEEDDQFLPELYRYPSLDSHLEENTSWLDDLLSDSDSSPQGRCHRRSASDSVTISQGYDSFSKSPNEAKDDSVIMHGRGLEENCVYGPNSPRHMSKLTNSESAMVNALLENIPGNKFEYVEIGGGSGVRELGHDEDASGEPELERTSRRRSGQRSRVRKLQYISDLQKTVEALQTMGAELSVQVASLFQQRVALSLENKSMRQQIAILRHEKIVKNGEHQYLTNEAEKLKMISGRHRRSKSISSPFMETSLHENNNTYSGTSWQSLDFRKLNFGGSNHSLGH